MRTVVCFSGLLFEILGLRGFGCFVNLGFVGGFGVDGGGVHLIVFQFGF